MSIIVPAAGPTPSPESSLTCETWATTADVCAPCDAYDFPQGNLAECLQAASDVLFMLSGRRYPGRCVDTVRPIASQNAPDPGRPVRSGWGAWASSMFTGGWWPGGGGGYFVGGGCAAPGTFEAGTFVPEVPLPGYPVVDVVYVRVDGAFLNGPGPPSPQFRVDDKRRLVRLPDPDGSRPGWPATQDLVLPASEPNTFEVKYVWGLRPPPAGVKAAAELGCQLAMACDPELAGECRLPERVQHIARQGFDAVVLDPLAFVDKGRTGLVDVDYFLQAVNPNRTVRSASVWRPGMQRRARRTG